MRHGRDLRNLVLSAGFEVSRVLRVQYGPVVLERGVPRACSMELKGDARDAIYKALGLAAPSEAAREEARAARATSRPERAAGRGKSTGGPRGRRRGPQS